jgi:hypothetical protein
MKGSTSFVNQKTPKNNPLNPRPTRENQTLNSLESFIAIKRASSSNPIHQRNVNIALKMLILMMVTKEKMFTMVMKEKMSMMMMMVKVVIEDGDEEKDDDDDDDGEDGDRRW